MSKRIGRFFISRHTIEDGPDRVQRVMAKCIIVRCEMLYERDCFEYLAISSDFDEISPGQMATNYEVIFNDNGTEEFRREPK